MPADWQTSQTLEDSLIRLAEAVGQADYSGAKAAVPTDPNLLDRLIRKWNDGYERFLRHRARWTFMEHVYELTTTADGSGPYNVENDPARYMLPDFLMGARPKGNWHYADTSSLYEKVMDTSWEIVREHYARHGQQTGAPRLAACQRNDNKGDSINNAARWEVIFWPKPGAVYTLLATFAIHRLRLTELQSKHPAGAQHDAAINACAKFEWFKDDSSSLKDSAKEEMMEELGRSVLIDLENEPKNLGKVRDTSLSGLLDGGRLRRFDRAGVTTHNGVSIV